MSLSDLLKSLFGDTGSQKEPNWRGVWEKDIDTRGPSTSPFSKFREGVHKQIEAIFKKFGYTRHSPGYESPEDIQPKINQQDILKGIEPFFNKEIESFMKREFGHFPPYEKEWEFHKPFKFGWSFGSNWDNTEQKDWKDEDIDGKIDDKDIRKMFEKLHKNPALNKPIDLPEKSSSHRSVSISTIMGADGRIEERKTVKDSSGNEETTVTRRFGDKTHSVTTKTNEKGFQEKVESMQNMDERDLTDFDEAWKNEGKLNQDWMSPPTKTSDKTNDEEVLSNIFKIKWK